MKRTLALLALALAALAGIAQERASLQLAVYMFRDTRWSRIEVEAAVARAGQLLSQCGVRVEPAQLHVIDAPERLRFYSTPAARELLRDMNVRKPALFFVEGTRNRPAYDAEAIGRGKSKSRPELADTVWIAFGARDLPQVIAHELVHVLSDSGAHSDEPDNLMAQDTAPWTTRLSAAQCGLLRSRGAANGLLAPL